MPKLYFIVSCMLCSIAAHSQTIERQLDSYVSQAKGDRSFNGTVLVVYKGKTLLYKGRGRKDARRKSNNDTGTIYRIGSLSKPFTATAILQLFEKQKLQLSDPLSAYIPDYPGGDSITITHLLTHSSGIKDYLEIKEIQNAPDDAPPISLEKLIAYFKNEPRNSQPGKKFAYSNSNFILLAYIIEKITGEKMEGVVRKNIFEPLGMGHSGFDFAHLTDTNKATGHMRSKGITNTVTDFDSTYAPGCGSVYTTAMDLYRFYKGMYDGKLFSDSTRELAFIPRQWKYGYGWFSYFLYGKKCISHAGGLPGFYSNMQFFPNDDLFIAILTNSSSGYVDTDKIASIVFQNRYQSSGL